MTEPTDTQRMNWSEGYSTDINYTFGYFRQLNPAMLRLSVLAGGYEPGLDGDFNYLELGFGQGISVSFHAAATQGTYWGNDFNPAQVAHARELVAASGAQAHLSDESFQEFAARSDLPEFDYIVLHGIWSWISAQNQDVIVDLIRRKLKAGGIVYASYNVYPGSAARIPARQLMSLFKDRLGSVMGTVGGIAETVQFTKDVFSAGADYYRDVPAIARHVETLGTENASYIAHEYLNANWNIATFADVAAHLGQGKITYAAPSNLLDNIEPLRFTPDARKILGQIGDPVLRETTKDFLTNQMFRCDVYVKGARRIPPADLARRWAAQRFVLTTHQTEIPQEVVLPLGQIYLTERVPSDVIAVLAEDGHAPKTVAQLTAHPALAHAGLEDIIETLLVLVGAGHASTAQVPCAATIARCRQLNRHVCDRARVVRQVECLASPVTGCAVDVPYICLLFLDAMHHGHGTVEAMTLHVWKFFDATGERMTLEGERVESREDNLALIEQIAGRFLDRMMPMLRALQVA